MENRFGIKDFFTFLCLAAIMGLIGLCLIQYERQWTQIQELKERTNSLTNDLTGIRNMLASGAVGPVQTGSNSPAGTSPAAALVDSLQPIRDAEKLPDFAAGDWLVQNFGTNIGKLTPLISTDVYATWVHARTMETLCGRNADTLKLVPLLATGWTQSEDGKTLTFDIRRGVVFSDGVPMTAKDIVWTFNWIMNPKVDASRTRAYLGHLESVTAEGDYRVVFKFKEFIFNTFNTVSQTLIMPEHFYSKYTPEQYNEIPGLLMGTGPYRLPSPTGWKPGDRVELVRNERYWGPRPAFDRLVFYDVKDDVVQETMYRNRELDRFAPTPEQFERLKDEPAIKNRSQALSYYSPVSGYTYLGWNQKRKINDKWEPTIFADKRVRQAMTMLIDRERLARELYYGHAQPATGPFGYGSPQTDPKITAWPYNPAKAKELLKEAGYIEKNGVMTNSEGKPLEFTLSYGSGNPFTDRIVLFIKDSLAQAGVKVNLDAVDWPILLKKLDRRDFEACTLGWSTSIETDCNQIFHSSQTSDQGDNFVNYISPELDKAIDTARSTVNEEERMKAWRQVHRILHEDQPYTFLLQRQALNFFDSRIKNIRITPLGLNMTLTEMTPLPWYVSKDDQLHKTAN